MGNASAQQMLLDDLSSPEGLTQALQAIGEEDRGWNSALGRRLLAEAERLLRPIAHAVGAEPDDAVTAAFEFWSTSKLPSTTNLWAYTTTVVKRALAREAIAQQKLTGTTSIRRASYRSALVIPFNENIPELVSIRETSRVADFGLGESHSVGVILVRKLLIMAELDRATAEDLIEHIVDEATSSPNPAAAVDRLSRDELTAAEAGLSHAQWRALVTLMLGTTRGKPGLIALATVGYMNPTTVSYIRRAIARLLVAEKR